MDFSFVIAVVLVCLTVGCNGQFKILGLLDTKSEVTNNGQVENVENIRALVDVDEQFSGDRDALKIIDEETVKDFQNVDVKKENVNFIKPYESVTTEWNRDVASDFVEAHVVQNGTTNDVQIADKTNGENASDRDGGASESISERNVASIPETSTISSTTTKETKTYRSECTIVTSDGGSRTQINTIIWSFFCNDFFFCLFESQ